MDIEQLREICLTVKGVEECLPFDEDTPVYKVMGRMFAFYPLTPKNGEFFVVMKCDPEKSLDLRERYTGVTKGFYAGNNLKWNSVYLQRDVPDSIIRELVYHSAGEVIKALSKKKQAEYHNQE